MRIIVTGGAGFIGSAVVECAVHRGHDVLTVDKLTYAGRREALDKVIDLPRHQFLQADIADAESIGTAFRDFDPDAILHLAAESHVDRSIDSASEFIATNISGTHVLLESSLRQWAGLTGKRREDFRFIHVSTDEVFGALGESGVFTQGSS